MTPADFRCLMPVTDRWAYFDHAAVAPLPASTRQAMEAQVTDLCLNGDVNWPNWRKNVERVRTFAAKLVGAETDEIAVIRNTTEGIGYVAEGFPWQAGDNVVVPSSEFPSNLFPWQHLKSRGVEVRMVEAPQERLDPAAVDAACDARTRIVALSWVGYATGWRNDPAVFAEIAHKHGGYLFLDAIQGLGVLPLDVRECGIDFLAADGHKWMLGPEGAGLFYVRRELLSELRPLLVGWNSVETAGDYSQTEMNFKPTAGRYEGGTYNMAAVAGLAESLRLLIHYGQPALSDALFAVNEQLCDRLRAVGAEIASDRSVEHRSGIVSFTVPEHSSANLCKTLLDAGVVLRERGGRLRASPHVYTSSEDLDRLISALPTG